MRKKLIIENKIPFIAGLAEEIADVRYLAPEEFTRENVAEADAMIIRTRTRCNEALLGSSACRFIATATIGTDHIDLDWCRKAGITVANAPGCNAPAVAQYVFAALMRTVGDLHGLTIGIVGVGHVGSIVERWATQLGMNVIACDPPRAIAEGRNDFSTLDEIAGKADIVTFHTPYATTGEFATHHLCGREFLDRCRRNPTVVNSARGAITDTEAVKAALSAGKISNAIIDCWENEPRIDRKLLAAATIATPHIAGYSREGKMRATLMALNAFADHFGLQRPTFPHKIRTGAADRVTPESIMLSYDPTADSARLKEHPELFESLRNHYDYRSEVS